MECACSEAACGVKKKALETLILAFEFIIAVLFFHFYKWADLKVHTQNEYGQLKNGKKNDN